MMRIGTISLQNYRQYQCLDIEFTKKTEYDLHYLLVENGIGKTTLLNAINWCLYGDEPHIGIKSQALPLINLGTFRNMQPGTTEDIVVKIEIEIKAGIITFERCWKVRKTEENKDYVISKSWKAITCFVGECAKVFENENADKYVNRFVPKRIRKFFFFDGEQLDTYFTDKTGLDVEQSIFEISQIDLLNSMKINLETISTEMRRDAAKINPEVDDYNEEYEHAVKVYSNEVKRIESINKQLSNARHELRVRNEELGDDPDIADLEIQRNGLDTKIKNNDQQRKDAEEALKNLIKKYTIVFYALPRMKNLYTIILDKQEKNQLPPRIDRDELENMLNEHHCTVCDRELDGKATVYLEALIKQYELNNASATLLTSIRGNIQSMINSASSYDSEKKIVIDSINRIEEDREEAIIEFNKVDSRIEKFTDKVRIKELHQERKDFEELVEKLNKESIIGEEKLKDYKNQRDESKELFEKELNKDKAHNSKIIEKDLAERATAIISSIISEIKDGVRVKISSEMNKVFNELIWKKETFSDIRLSDAYRMSLINIDGFECLGTCSAAERELLALSFTLALHKESGFEGPLVIDTPISRISGVLRANFAKCLRDVSQSKQIILFLTKDEYSVQVKDIFEPTVSCKYALGLKNEILVEKRCL